VYNYTDADRLKDSIKQIIEPCLSVGLLTKNDREWIENKLEGLRSFIEESNLLEEYFWEQFREKFFGFAQHEVADPKIPMNAANLCPEPTPLLEVANLLRLRYNENVSQQQRMNKGLRVQQLTWARKQLAKGLGFPDECDPNFNIDIDLNSIAMVRNASEANNAVSRSFNGWNADGNDNVVLWSENHPTNLAAWKLRAQENFFEVRVVEFDFTWDEGQIIKQFCDAIDGQTRFVSYSWISNSTGFRIPDAVRTGIWNSVEEKVGLNNCHIHVDGTMAWGGCEVKLKDNTFCHSFVSSAHKWFLGPKETGILWMHRHKVANFNPSIYAYDYQIRIHDQWPDSALRFELLGQRDDVNLITLGLTQEMWLRLEASGRDPYGRIKQLNQYLVNKLKALKECPDIPNNDKWYIVTPNDNDSRRLGIIVINIEEVFSNPTQDNDENNLYNWLYENKRIAGSGSNKTFRLCPHIYNTKSDIDNAVAGIEEWLNIVSGAF
jgi:selenocysteine lyase/cysteine desulfurase